MTGNIVSRRYAKALLEVVEGPGEIQKTEKELLDIAVLINGDQRLKNLLYNPSVDMVLKKNILGEIIKRAEITTATSKFLNLLLEKNRLKFLLSIAQEFEGFSNEANNRIKATITTSCPISDDSRNRLKDKLEAMMNKEVLLEEKIEPSLIGGVRIQAEGYVIDGSIKAQLGYLKEELLRGVKG